MNPRQIERIVGIFLAAGFLGLVLLVALSIIGSGWFVERNHYTLTLDHGTGIVPGTTVTISGIGVGRVEQVRLEPDQQVMVQLGIEEQYAGFIREDSVGRVSTTLTGKIVIIDKGSTDSPVLADGGALVGGHHFDVMVALERMDLVGNLQRLEAIMAEINQLAKQMQLGDGRFPEAVDNAIGILDDLQQGRGSVGRILKEDALVEDLDQTLASTEQMIAAIDTTAARLTEMAEALESAGTAVQGSTRDITQVASDIHKTSEDIGRSADRLVGTMDRLDASLVELGKTMDAIQKIPFVRGQMKKQEKDGEGAPTEVTEAP